MITVITLLSTLPLSQRWKDIVSKIKGDVKLFVNNPDYYPINADYQTRIKIKQPDLGSFEKNETDVINQLCNILHVLIGKVESEYILLLDDDIIPPDDFVDQLLSNLNDQISFAVALSPQSNWPLDNPNTSGTVSFSLDWWWNKNIRHYPKQPFKVLAGGFNCCVCKTEDLRKCLPLKAELDGMTVKGWDWTIGYSIQEIGKEIICDPRVLCEHMKY